MVREEQEEHSDEQDSYYSMWKSHGKASLLPQYDDITLRRMESINAVANLSTWVIGNRRGLYNTILAFHQVFGGLVASTLLELKDSGNKGMALSDNDETRVRAFLYNTFDNITLIDGNTESPRNREELKKVGREAVAIHEIYERALKAAGYRKITFSTLSETERWRKIG